MIETKSNNQTYKKRFYITIFNLSLKAFGDELFVKSSTKNFMMALRAESL